MKQYNKDIANVMDEALQQHATSVQFGDVWESKIKGVERKLKFGRHKNTPLIAVIALVMLFIVGFTGYTVGSTVFQKIDKTDYPFVDDTGVIGRWEAVDFVNKIEDFNPEKKSWTDKLYLTSLIFINEGKMLAAVENGNIAYTSATWTKDIIISKQEKTASRYTIEEINGDMYMFYQWKSGDYVFGNATPSFYVLKKLDSEDYSDYEVKAVKEDNVDYEFVDDDDMKGKWESVDFVRTIDSFKPADRYWLGDLHLKKINIEKSGKVTFTTTSGSYSSQEVTWTKGLIIDKRDKTASKCEVKEINGTTYMFYEWKSGDYIYRGMEPCYYVLKKVK